MQQESQILSILGLQSTLLDDPILCTHYSTETRIAEEFIHNKKSLRVEDTWEKALWKLGFTEQKSKSLAEVIETKQYSSHLTPELFAIKYLDLQFRFHRQFTLLPQRNYIQEIKDIEDIPKLNISFISRDESQNLNDNKQLEKYLTQPKSQMEKVKYWFHGTDIHSAFHILDMGIMIGGGTKRASFSNGDGFYMTSDFEFAFHWSQCIPTPEPFESAVIVFEDNNKTLNTTKNGICLNDDSPQLHKIMNYFKRNENRYGLGMTKAEVKTIESYDFIFGPIPKHQTPKSVEDETKFQLCIRRGDMADRFFNNYQNIKEVIIFKQ